MRKEMYPALFSADGTGGYTVVFPELNFSRILQRALKEELELV